MKNPFAPVTSKPAPWSREHYSDAAPEGLAPTAPQRSVAVEAGAQSPHPTHQHHHHRKARLRIERVDPWSVMKTTFLFSVAFGVMFWVATYIVWSVIGASGLFDALNKTLTDVLSSPTDQTPIHLEDILSTNKMMGISALLVLVNVVITTALGTVLAFLYNLAAVLMGGIEITLAED